MTLQQPDDTDTIERTTDMVETPHDTPTLDVTAIDGANAPTPTLRNARKIAPDDRAALVVGSLYVPSLTRYAHQSGLALSTLSTWRGDARDGLIKVDDETRAVLLEQMPLKAFKRRNRSGKPMRRLDEKAAAAAVIDSVNSRHDQEDIAARHGISLTQLTQLRARARDGLIEIPIIDRAMLTSRSVPRRNLTKSKLPVQAVSLAAAPRARATKVMKVASITDAIAVVSSLSAQTFDDALDNAPQDDLITISLKGHVIEISRKIDTDDLQSILSAIAAA
ncbi:hypothetical protein ACOI1H_19215 [Loktanella sp. DJP18]|uniref:hypothetical protein n=1 Tax=Loktanella sp. DJP18 TaxID=3409788 RepID=UPI003BB6E50C